MLRGVPDGLVRHMGLIQLGVEYAIAIGNHGVGHRRTGTVANNGHGNKKYANIVCRGSATACRIIAFIHVLNQERSEFATVRVALSVGAESYVMDSQCKVQLGVDCTISDWSTRWIDRILCTGVSHREPETGGWKVLDGSRPFEPYLLHGFSSSIRRRRRRGFPTSKRISHHRASSWAVQTLAIPIKSKGRLLHLALDLSTHSLANIPQPRHT